jgi:hypothetical protein
MVMKRELGESQPWPLCEDLSWSSTSPEVLRLGLTGLGQTLGLRTAYLQPAQNPRESRVYSHKACAVGIDTLGEAQIHRDRPEAKLHCAASQRKSLPRLQRLSITTKRATPCRQHPSRYRTANPFLSIPFLSRATCDSSAEVYRRIPLLGNVRRVGKSEDLPPVDLKRTACLDTPAEHCSYNRKTSFVRSCSFTAVQGAMLRRRA